MKVMSRRWGEVTIKKQGEAKNFFDKTKSFSIQETETNYSIDDYFEVLQLTTNLTEKIGFRELKTRLGKV